MKITMHVNGQERTGEIDVENSCLVVTLGSLELRVDRRPIREAMNGLGYGVDHNMWWDGYNECLADVERAVARGEGPRLLKWVGEVRQKFGLQLQGQ